MIRRLLIFGPMSLALRQGHEKFCAKQNRCNRNKRNQRVAAER
jgi:hypothetical protein